MESLKRDVTMFTKEPDPAALSGIGSEAISAERDRANSAAVAGDSESVIESCKRILANNQNDKEALCLLAEFDGWDSKTYHFNRSNAFHSIVQAVEHVPESERYALAAKIYNSRKKQIAALLESELSMPSHTSAKNLQETMLLWKDLLVQTGSVENVGVRA